MRKLTKKRLKTMKPCSDGFQYWLENCESLDTDKQLLKLVRYHADWANWLIVRLMNGKQKIRYAIYAAEQVIDIYEKKHPKNKKPREAIKAAKEVLKKDSKNNRDAANAAADAAYTATYAADAANAAADAAYTATYAADAANAAAYAAYTAADAAAYAANAAAKKRMQVKIVRYGIKLLNGGE